MKPHLPFHAYHADRVRIEKQVDIIRLKAALEAAARQFDYTVSALSKGQTVSISSLQNCAAVARAEAEAQSTAPDGLAIAQRWMAWATGPVVPIAVRMQLQADTEAFIAKATGSTP